MSKQNTLSKQIRTNWLIDFAAFLGFILAGLSGILFLVLPSNNELSAIHEVGFVLAIVATVIHLVRHWKWVKTMVRRSIEGLSSKGVGSPKSVRLNVIIDASIAICFLITVVSGVSLEHRSENSGNIDQRSYDSLQSNVSGKGLFGNRRDTGIDMENLIVDNAADPAFQWAALDLTHLWAAIILLVLLVIHLWLHRHWVSNVTRRVLISPGPWAGLS